MPCFGIFNAVIPLKDFIKFVLLYTYAFIFDADDH